MPDIDQFRRFNRAENYVVTMHGRRRMSERGILLADVMRAVDQGEIIESHPEDYPFPSCLILGLSVPLLELLMEIPGLRLKHEFYLLYLAAFFLSALLFETTGHRNLTLRILPALPVAENICKSHSMKDLDPEYIKNP